MGRFGGQLDISRHFSGDPTVYRTSDRKIKKARTAYSAHSGFFQFLNPGKLNTFWTIYYVYRLQSFGKPHHR